MSTTLKITSDMIRDYLDRHLGPREEQAFEEAMLDSPELVDQVRTEMALRRGFKDLSRREGTKLGPAKVETEAADSNASNVTPFVRRKGGPAA